MRPTDTVGLWKVDAGEAGMLTVELLEQALDLALRSGYKIRQEWLDGSSGGACIIHGEKWLFLDPTRSRRDLLSDVLDALWADPDVIAIDVSAELQRELDGRKGEGQKPTKRKAA
jgi:hypothetical protein